MISRINDSQELVLRGDSSLLKLTFLCIYKSDNMPTDGHRFVSVVIISSHKIHVTKAMSLEGFGTALKQL